ncbi:CaiB/BaiF CoA transferase family protein [Polaromonas sp.]|uniref:CaiB/BaiF CoA transferase family protein n=1 Tax=Polaromonas sp. TaxID=1869339 RepID=UPI003BA96B28
MSNILEGVRVMELGQVLAAPFGGAILAALGAEVIKVERVDGGDDARRMGPAFRNGDSLIFQIFNAGKKSVALDMKSSAGRSAFDQLLAGVDILVHNLRPGVTLDLGIDAATLCERHPRLIYCEISAFGHKGPMRMLPGYEPLVQAFSGLSSTNGGPGDPPIRSATSLCDQGSGMWAVIGALAMLAQRQRTGRGGVVQTSLLETALSWNAQKADAYRNEGRLPERHRSGHPGFVPYESFETQDGPLLICCGNDRLFAKLAVELGHPEWIADERYSTNRARLLHKASLLPQLAIALQAHPRAQWLERLTRAGVPCAPVHSIPEAMDHPHVQALDMFTRVGAIDFSLTAMPISFDGERPAYAHAAPTLGQNNVELGLAAAGITGVAQ